MSLFDLSATTYDARPASTSGISRSWPRSSPSRGRPTSRQSPRSASDTIRSRSRRSVLDRSTGRHIGVQHTDETVLLLLSASASGGGRAEAVEVVLAECGGGVDPAELERHAVAEVAGLDVDGIGDEERAFGQLERDDGVGQRILREVAAVECRPREYLRLAAERGPREVVGQAAVAGRARRPAELPTGRALLQAQLSRQCERPELLGVRIHRAYRSGRRHCAAPLV